MGGGSLLSIVQPFWPRHFRRASSPMRRSPGRRRSPNPSINRGYRATSMSYRSRPTIHRHQRRSPSARRCSSIHAFLPTTRRPAQPVEGSKGVLESFTQRKNVTVNLNTHAGNRSNGMPQSGEVLSFPNECDLRVRSAGVSRAHIFAIALRPLVAP
jgi:hypothetical protein